MSRKYLEQAKITAFGAFSNRIVGPFGPGMNVVFGENEAGKTTLSSFIGGVLFGWEDARGRRNTYKPENAERAGSLLFAAADSDEMAELSRVRNADGLQGDVALASDIDRDTYKTMFSLNSDELRELNNSNEVTAKLLTAGSGTESSPAHALADLQECIAGYTSRAAAMEHSLANLAAEQDEVREQISIASAQMERLKRENQELSELGPERDRLLAKLSELNRSIESMTAARAELEKLEDMIDSLKAQVAELTEQEEDLRRDHRAALREHPAELTAINAADERRLRDRIDALASDEAKREHAADLARDNHATSKASYEALQEAAGVPSEESRTKVNQYLQVILSIALPVIFMIAGVPLFMHGREISSLSYTTLGFGLVVAAVVMAFAAIVLIIRPNKAVNPEDTRLEDARWVMLQDAKKLEGTLADQRQLAARISAELANMGLAGAEGSLRRARAMLDEAKEVRAESQLYLQRKQAAVSRRTSDEAALADAEARRDELFAKAALQENTLSALDAAIDARARQREGLMDTCEHLNRRYGELKQTLDQARGERSFDELKLRYQELQTRRDRSAVELAELLLARRMLETAISAWESKSQPEVYRKAGELLSLMTEGKWVKVEMSAEGHMLVTDSLHNHRDPLKLSLGTCQQLYLALRIALLLTADNVGAAIPIIADDILVNFDARRRAGAARALVELSRKRQVILLTCHEEIVDTVRACDPQLRVVHL